MVDNVKIIFIVKGEKKEFLVPVGTTVLEAAHNNDIDLEGACEGSLACSTCHVIVDKSYYSKLEQASEDEEDMLDLAFGLTPTSRLGCQITMTKDLDGLTLTVPDETRNVSV
ncbi:MAG: ferredoxin family 2Fe-2S iron-sulfur cluster binding protein [Rickettsiales bacterium]|jgi:2Fe-2S ferredoxin|nr:ferredoxin family 2Fe-2S iron-sulfur cluster binding protein [Rickettsiales bacterium]